MIASQYIFTAAVGAVSIIILAQTPPDKYHYPQIVAAQVEV